jgi:hypothetical protein
MDHAALKQMMQWAFCDIRREIALAKASEMENGKDALKQLGIPPGGGNFMAALALLCYTEFGGKLMFNCKKKGKKGDYDDAARNFNLFFDRLAPTYKAFTEAGHKVYDVFRCGLAHEYYVKKACTIFMFHPPGAPGIGVLPDGRYYFAVEPYCDDLAHAFVELEERLFGTVTDVEK